MKVDSVNEAGSQLEADGGTITVGSVNAKDSQVICASKGWLSVTAKH